MAARHFYVGIDVGSVSVNVVVLDAERNRAPDGDCVISAETSRVAVLVIHTDEERMIAEDAYRVASGAAEGSPAGPAGTRD